MTKNILIISFILFLFCCKKTDNNEDSNQPLMFTSLVAEKNTIEIGTTVKITATATGYKLTYNWSASLGDILGNGAEVIYTASPCQIGENTISCIVKDGNGNSEKKEVIIEVL